MVDVVMLERQRENFLLALYELVDGHTNTNVAIRDVVSMAGISPQESHLICRDVAGSHYCKNIGGGPFDGAVELTSSGQRAAERLLTQRSPRIDDATLVQNVEVVVRVLLIEVQNNSVLTPDERLNVESDLRSVQDQLKAPVPNRAVIKSGLERVCRLWPTVVELVQVAAALKVILLGW